jgi:hypothetical protein
MHFTSIYGYIEKMLYATPSKQSVNFLLRSAIARFCLYGYNKDCIEG